MFIEKVSSEHENVLNKQERKLIFGLFYLFGVTNASRSKLYNNVNFIIIAGHKNFICLLYQLFQ